MYTHRWLRPPILDRHRYAALVADVRLLIDQLLAHWLVRVNVRLNEHCIVFSLDRMTWRDDRCLGGGDVAEGTPCWELCTTDVPTRTAAYDMLVCTLLIAFRHHFPEITFESELPRTLWSDALVWYRQCFPDRLVVPGPWMAVPEGG